MRTLNIKAGSMMASQPINNFPEDRQPCWYADMESAEEKEDYRWKVGCKHEGRNDEYSFHISKGGDVNDNNFWIRATGSDFAVKLIELFRNGGKEAVKGWVKKGCP